MVRKTNGALIVTQCDVLQEEACKDNERKGKQRQRATATDDAVHVHRVCSSEESGTRESLLKREVKSSRVG